MPGQVGILAPGMTRTIRDHLVRRVNALPLSARRVVGLGCLQRCWPFYLRNIDVYPPSAAYRPAIERGLELAWARHEGRPVDEDECRRISAEMATFKPETPGGWDGDWSWLALGPMALADELHFHIHHTWDDYITDALDSASDLVFSWYEAAEIEAGRNTTLEDHERVGTELISIVDEWRADQIGLL